MSDVDVLTTDFRVWIADNLARGAPPSEVVQALTEYGVPHALASAEVEELDRPAVRAVMAELIRRLDRRDQVFRLARHLRQAAMTCGPRETNAATTEDIRAAVGLARPLVIRGGASHWPALGRWSLDWFAERFGDVEIDVCVGRDADPECDRNFAEHTRRMPLRSYIRRIRESGPSNDAYAIANNRLLHHPALAALFEDIRPNAELYPAMTPTDTSLWIGPAGTKTPLHHDCTSIHFAQIVGEKRFRLVSPFETRLLDAADGFYVFVDLDGEAWRERFGDVVVHDVTLGAGDVLILPAGWWHTVDALSESISFSLLGLPFDNDYPWYRPGQTRLAPRAVPEDV